MSDQENIVDEELDLDESGQIPQKKGPFLSPLIIRVLLIVALQLLLTYACRKTFAQSDQVIRHNNLGNPFYTSPLYMQLIDIFISLNSVLMIIFKIKGLE